MTPQEQLAFALSLKRKADGDVGPDKAQLRAIKNRASAIESREKKKQRLESLETDNAQLRQMNSQLLARLDSLEASNSKLVEQLQTLSAQLSSAFHISSGPGLSIPSAHIPSTSTSNNSSHNTSNNGPSSLNTFNTSTQEQEQQEQDFCLLSQEELDVYAINDFGNPQTVSLALSGPTATTSLQRMRAYHRLRSLPLVSTPSTHYISLTSSQARLNNHQALKVPTPFKPTLTSCSLGSVEFGTPFLIRFPICAAILRSYNTS